MPVDRTDGRPQRIYLNDDGSEYERCEHLTLIEKTERLASTFGKDRILLGHAYSYVNTGTYWSPRIISAVEPRPEYVHYDDIHGGYYASNPALPHYCGSPAAPDCPHRLFIDLSDIAMDANPHGSSGSCEESNMRRLTEDYPNVFTKISYSNVDALGAFIGNLTEPLIDILCGLRSDYPAYDDEDMTALEMQWADDSWQQFVSHDIDDEIEEHCGEPFRDMWDALAGIPAPDGDSATDMQHQIFITANTENDGNEFWYAEADSVAWDYKLLAEKMGEILSRYFSSEPLNYDAVFWPWRAEQADDSEGKLF